MSLCAQFLTAARKVARNRKGWVDRACAVFDHGGGHFEVRDYEDRIVWQGEAHCRYCARAEAITSMVGTELTP